MKELIYIKYPRFKLFTAGFLFSDAINHSVQIINNSPFSVHGLKIGIWGNWIVLIVDIILILFLLRKSK